MREVKAEPRANSLQGEKLVIAAGDTDASALGWLVRASATPTAGLGRLSRANFKVQSDQRDKSALQQNRLFGKRQTRKWQTIKPISP